MDYSSTSSSQTETDMNSCDSDRELTHLTDDPISNPAKLKMKASNVNDHKTQPNRSDNVLKPGEFSQKVPSCIFMVINTFAV